VIQGAPILPAAGAYHCVDCQIQLAIVMDRRYGTDMSDREVYLLCPRCWIKRRRDELVARAELLVDELRTLGYDVDLRVDGEDH
jgi:hypothetical protein